MIESNGTGTVTLTGSFVFKGPEYSEWTCELFGTTGTSMHFRPTKGGEPNWFWRWMQFLILGNRWRRVTQ